MIYGMGRPRKNPVAQAVAASKKIQNLDGLFDVTTEVDALWDVTLRRFAKIAKTYGFHRIETPLAEDISLYQNFYGQQKPAIQSILSLLAGGKQIGIRPSLLPSVMRAYAQGKVYEKVPMSKWFFSGETITQQPQTLKLRSDFEFGVEIFGTFNHLSEAQSISAIWNYLDGFGIPGLVLEINNIGTTECQLLYQDTLLDFLSGKKYQLCDNCNEHLSGRVLNVFRCDNLDCQAIVSEAPAILDFLDEASRRHFTNILEALDEMHIPYQLSPNFVSSGGHSKTNFAIRYKGKSGSVTIGEGGYHDQLLQSVSGKNFCCFGFTGSLVQVKNILESVKVEVQDTGRQEVFLVPLGELAAKKSLRLFKDLITEHISVHDHFGNSGVKNQLKAAELSKAPIALIIGQKEAVDEMVILRDVKSGMQEIISYDKIVEEVKKRLGR